MEATLVEPNFAPQRGRKHELARQIAREMVTCPGCLKQVRIATLQYSHKCSKNATVPSDEDKERRLDVARKRAIETFLQRQTPDENILAATINDAIETTEVDPDSSGLESGSDTNNRC